MFEFVSTHLFPKEICGSFGGKKSPFSNIGIYVQIYWKTPEGKKRILLTFFFFFLSLQKQSPWLRNTHLHIQTGTDALGIEMAVKLAAPPRSRRMLAVSEEITFSNRRRVSQLYQLLKGSIPIPPTCVMLIKMSLGGLPGIFRVTDYTHILRKKHSWNGHQACKAFATFFCLV